MEQDQLINEINQSVSEMRAQVASTEKRLGSLFTRLGLEADGEALHNLKSMASNIADQEIMLERLKRSRNTSDLETGADGRIKDAHGKPIFYADPKEEARAVIAASDSYRRALIAGIRSGGDGFKSLDPENQAILSFKHIPAEVQGKVERIMGQKAVGLATDIGQGAGFFAPPTVESTIDRVQLETSAVDRYARTVVIGGSAYEGVLRTINRDTVQEFGERNYPTAQTETRRYEDRRIEVWNSGVAPGLTSQMLEDSVIDLIAELQADAAQDFAQYSGSKWVKGTGIKQAEGVMTNTEIAEMHSGDPSTFTMESLKRLPQQLKLFYRTNARYFLSRDALTTAMLWRTAPNGPQTGTFLWEPSTQAGIPSMLNGYGWSELVDMDAVAANAHPVLFGDMYQGYRIVRRRGITILRDELTQKPYIIFFMTRREGGRVWMAEALVKMKIAA